MEPVKLTRAGAHVMVKAASRAAVEAAVAELVAKGAQLVDSIKALGNNWIATVVDQAAPEATDWVEVTSIGLQSVIAGSSFQIVSERVAELTTFGSALVAGPELVEGKWVAVVDTRGERP
jgi:hypothetical protein